MSASINSRTTSLGPSVASSPSAAGAAARTALLAETANYEEQTVMVEQLQRELASTLGMGMGAGPTMIYAHEQQQQHHHHHPHNQVHLHQPFTQEGLVYDLLKNAQESAARLKVELDSARVEKEVCAQECLQLKHQNKRLLDDQEQLTLSRRDLEGKLQFRMNQVLGLEQERSKGSLKETELTERLSVLERQNNALRSDLVASNTELRVAMARNASLELRLQDQAKAAAVDTVPIAVYRNAQDELERHRVEAAAHAKSLQANLDDVRRRYGELSEKRVKDLEFSRGVTDRAGGAADSRARQTSPAKSASSGPAAEATAVPAAKRQPPTHPSSQGFASSLQQTASPQLWPAQAAKPAPAEPLDRSKLPAHTTPPTVPSPPETTATSSASSATINSRYLATKEVLTSSDEEGDSNTRKRGSGGAKAGVAVLGGAEQLASSADARKALGAGATTAATASTAAVAASRVGTTSASSAFALARRASTAIQVRSPPATGTGAGAKRATTAAASASAPKSAAAPSSSSGQTAPPAKRATSAKISATPPAASSSRQAALLPPAPSSAPARMRPTGASPPVPKRASIVTPTGRAGFTPPTPTNAGRRKGSL